MKPVCVITGGGSVMVFAAAKRMGQSGYYLIVASRNAAKLQTAVKELTALGCAAEAASCDIGDEASVEALAKTAAERGPVQVVLHIAGLSPHMGDAEKIMSANALGTIYMHGAFYPVLEAGGCLVDTSSISAYLAPEFIMPRRTFALAMTDPKRLQQKLLARVGLIPKAHRPGLAYAISKYFVIWYAQKDAARFGAKGARVVCIVPGNFETPMGELEKADAEKYLRYNALPRFGQPDEIAALFAAVSDPAMGYLTGCAILCDGGCVGGRR